MELILLSRASNLCLCTASIDYSVFYVFQFRGGATQHGPKPRSHEIGLQKQVRRLGLKVALSSRVAEGKVQSHVLCPRNKIL